MTPARLFSLPKLAPKSEGFRAGLEAPVEAMALRGHSGERMFEADLYRVKGWLLLMAATGFTTAIESEHLLTQAVRCGMAPKLRR